MDIEQSQIIKELVAFNLLDMECSDNECARTVIQSRRHLSEFRSGLRMISKLLAKHVAIVDDLPLTFSNDSYAHSSELQSSFYAPSFPLTSCTYIKHSA